MIICQPLYRSKPLSMDYCPYKSPRIWVNRTTLTSKTPIISSRRTWNQSIIPLEGTEWIPRSNPDGNTVRPCQPGPLCPPYQPRSNAHHPGVDTFSQRKAAPQGEQRVPLSVRWMSSGRNHLLSTSTQGLQGYTPLPPQARLHKIFTHNHHRTHQQPLQSLHLNLGNRPCNKKHPTLGIIKPRINNREAL